jgi:hypothetical protein
MWEINSVENSSNENSNNTCACSLSSFDLTFNLIEPTPTIVNNQISNNGDGINVGSFNPTFESQFTTIQSSQINNDAMSISYNDTTFENQFNSTHNQQIMSIKEMDTSLELPAFSTQTESFSSIPTTSSLADLPQLTNNLFGFEGVTKMIKPCLKHLYVKKLISFN